MKDPIGDRDYRDPNRYDYHYNRDDRLAKMPDELRGRVDGALPRGLFRRNRTLGVILIDIMIIALVWFVFLPLIRTGASGRIEGYSFVLKSFSYGGKALISLTAVKEHESRSGSPFYTATFGLSSSNATTEMHGDLPKLLHGSTSLRTSLPLKGKTTAVVCRLTIGTEHLSLKARLQPES